MKDIKLTEKEKAFAEERHALIYSFLHKYGLPEDDFYDIAAIGYLRAVRRYHREKKLQKYSFNTIAWSAMAVDVGNKKRSDRIRDALIAFSINDLTEDGTEYGDFIEDKKNAFRELEERENLQELLKRIMPALTERQRDHLIKTLDGYKPAEIMHEQRVRPQEYHEDTRRIRAAAAEVLPFPRRGGVLRRAA